MLDRTRQLDGTRESTSIIHVGIERVCKVLLADKDGRGLRKWEQNHSALVWFYFLLIIRGLRYPGNIPNGHLLSSAKYCTDFGVD